MIRHARSELGSLPGLPPTPSFAHGCYYSRQTGWLLSGRGNPRIESQPTVARRHTGGATQGGEPHPARAHPRHKDQQAHAAAARPLRRSPSQTNAHPPAISGPTRRLPCSEPQQKAPIDFAAVGGHDRAVCKARRRFQAGLHATHRIPHVVCACVQANTSQAHRRRSPVAHSAEAKSATAPSAHVRTHARTHARTRAQRTAGNLRRWCRQGRQDGSAFSGRSVLFCGSIGNGSEAGRGREGGWAGLARLGRTVGRAGGSGVREYCLLHEPRRIAAAALTGLWA